MRGSLLLIVSSLMVLDVWPAGAQAQLIGGGSDSVRAPYEVAQRRGRLRDRIRSRFRQDESPPEEAEPIEPQQRYPGAIQPLPVPPAVPLRSTTRPIPAPQVASSMLDQQSLQTSLILAEAELDRQLSASSSGDAYRKYLRVGEVSEVLLETPDLSLTAPGRQRLQQILNVYNRMRIDPRQRWASALSGFVKVQAGLTQVLAPAEIVEPRSEPVSVDRLRSPLLQKPTRTGEPQPTQVLPSVRDSY
jgi:hypothetical protein